MPSASYALTSPPSSRNRTTVCMSPSRAASKISTGIVILDLRRAPKPRRESGGSTCVARRWRATGLHRFCSAGSENDAGVGASPPARKHYMRRTARRKRRHKGHQTRDFANVLAWFDSSKESSTESRWTPLGADYSNAPEAKNSCREATLRPPAARSDRNITKDVVFQDRSVPSEELLA